MVRFRNIGLALLLLGTGWMTSPALKAQEIPPVLWYGPHEAKAAWVSLERSVFSNGRIDWSLFGDLQAAILKNRLENHKGSECISIGPLRKDFMDSRAAHDLQSLVEKSFGIIRGTVVDREVGFVDGDPATLLAVRVEENIKPSSEISSEGLLYVAYPVAEFTVDGVRICKSDPRLLAVPKEGDSILLLPLSRPLNAERNLIYPQSQEVIIEKRGGALDIPAKWAVDDTLRKASSLSEVGRIIKRMEKSPAETLRKEGL